MSLRASQPPHTRTHGGRWRRCLTACAWSWGRICDPRGVPPTFPQCRGSLIPLINEPLAGRLSGSPRCERRSRWPGPSNFRYDSSAMPTHTGPPSGVGNTRPKAPPVPCARLRACFRVFTPQPGLLHAALGPGAQTSPDTPTLPPRCSPGPGLLQVHLAPAQYSTQPGLLLVHLGPVRGRPWPVGWATE